MPELVGARAARRRPELATTNADFVSWTRALLTFRAAHAALRPRTFFDGTDHDGNGLPDVAWRVDGQEGGDAARSLYVAWNGWTGDIAATVPAAGGGKAWYVAGDSASGRFAAPGAEPPLGGGTLDVKARSVAVLVER